MLKMHGLAGIGLLCGMMLTGCVGYNTWPPQEGVSGLSAPNVRPNDQVILASLQYVVERYPADSDEYAVNLPEGISPSLYRWIVDRVGEGAQPLTRENEHLPIYHVKQIKVRGREAEVLVLRPVTEAGLGPDGEPAYQPITVSLSGRIASGWRIVNRREWIVGLEETPEPYYWTDGDETETQVAAADEGSEPESQVAETADLDEPATTAEVPDDQ